jgi:hypothetical protein
MRLGAYFGSLTPMEFSDPAHLGNHNSRSGVNETNGMVYTCKGGFIDIGHVREGADRTAYLQGLIYQNLLRQRRFFTFHVIEPSRYNVRLEYPTNWSYLAAEDKTKIAREVSISVGQYLAHTSLIWHEIITMYGFSSLGFFPETISAFSAEDSYSDLLGTCLAVEALRKPGSNFDDAMTKLIQQALKELDVQSAETAKRAAKAVEGRWYTGGLYFFVDLKVRNFDVGLDDGTITPLLVPGICRNTAPRFYDAPGPEVLTQYGFRFEVEIEPKVSERKKIYEIIKLDKNSLIKPQMHFPRIIQHIENEAGKPVLWGAVR